MITFQEAEHLIQDELKKMEMGGLPSLIITSHIAEDFGWVFFYNSRAFFIDGDLSYQLAGNGPLIVDKKTGTIYRTETTRPIEDIISRFRQKLT